MRSLALWTFVGAALAAGCGGEGGGEGTFDTSGTVDIVGSSGSQVFAAGATGGGAPCQGVGDLGAFREHAEVIVLDADGTQVAVGMLGRGKIPEAAGAAHESPRLTPCTFEFDVSEIPASGGPFTARVDEAEVTFEQGDGAVEIRVSGDQYP
ncbi:hypothetical protein [Nocardioides donggukensis]|uniref:Lipoprotein n=1 Tax=Nocardioides donggukensis TaxID=2774019 RepID=A0A927K6S0_9ACTN|nr:hypothetical protein [Nocardioides donggukensis]MBD8870966.1 hypothetical protein [Nocardioides donggukensis]